MGALPLGVFQILAAEFSRMGGTLDRAVGLGACLLPATARARGKEHHAAVRALAFKWIRTRGSPLGRQRFAGGIRANASQVQTRVFRLRCGDSPLQRRS